MKFELLGRIPSKKNSKIIVTIGKSPRLLPSKNFKEWHKEASQQLKEQGIKKVDGSNLKMLIEIYSPDRRKFDIDNKTTSILDLLVDNNILEDDNYEVINELTIVYRGIEKGGRAIITINENKKTIEEDEAS